MILIYIVWALNATGGYYPIPFVQEPKVYVNAEACEVARQDRLKEAFIPEPNQVRTIACVPTPVPKKF